MHQWLANSLSARKSPDRKALLQTALPTVALTTCFATCHLLKQARQDDSQRPLRSDGISRARPEVGGRTDRIGLNALYLALDVNIALLDDQ
jgi:hypothetical protein